MAAFSCDVKSFNMSVSSSNVLKTPTRYPPIPDDSKELLRDCDPNTSELNISDETLRDRRGDQSYTSLTSSQYFTADESVPPVNNSASSVVTKTPPLKNRPFPTSAENKLSILLTNARSLNPKLCSLIEFFKELDVTAGIITESWFVDGPELDKDLLDLELGTGLKAIYKNRTKAKKKTHRYGTANQRGGGVVIVFNSNEINLVEHKIQGNTYELVAATGRQRRSGRHIYLFGVYVPPKMKVGPFQNLMECIVNEIGRIKSKYSDAVIIIGGDMNRRDFKTLTDAYNDITTINTDPTRGIARLDLLATNIENLSIGNDIFPPLETEEGQESDPSIVLSKYALSKKCVREWRKYQARKKTDEGVRLFDSLLTEQSWVSVYAAESTSRAAEELTEILEGLMNRCFPKNI